VNEPIVLWGRDHTELGEVAVRAPVPGAAGALSRGALPKAYDYVDPNEDAVALAAGGRATLAVVADGHGGIQASEAAVSYMSQRLAHDPPPADLTDDALVALFHEAGEAVMSAAYDGYQRRYSGTTLAIALVTAERLQWASYGDSAVFAGDGGQVLRLDRPLHRFLGCSISSEQMRAELSRGTYARPNGAWVVLASDGFTDYLETAPEQAVRHALRQGVPGAVAEALVRRAFAGGAGDNVAVACVAPAC